MFVKVGEYKGSGIIDSTYSTQNLESPSVQNTIISPGITGRYIRKSKVCTWTVAHMEGYPQLLLNVMCVVEAHFLLHDDVNIQKSCHTVVST